MKMLVGALATLGIFGFLLLIVFQIAFYVGIVWFALSLTTSTLKNLTLNCDKSYTIEKYHVEGNFFCPSEEKQNDKK